MRPARTTAPLALVALVSAAFAAGGCGGSSDSGASDFAELTSHLPPGTAMIAAVDVDGLRSDLWLDADADATDVSAAFKSGVEAQDPQQRLVRDTGIAFPAVGQELQGVADPAAGAVDGSQIHAVVSTGNGDITITAVSTSQSFDEIADALTQQGYTRDGNLLSAASGQEPIGGVADGGDGVVLLARSAPQASEAADEKTGPQALGGLFDLVDGPVRVASNGSDSAGGDCISGIAVGQSADATEGKAVLEVSGDADAASVDTQELDATDPSFDFSEPEVDASKLTVDFKGVAPDIAKSTPLEGLVDTFTVYSAYNCK